MTLQIDDEQEKAFLAGAMNVVRRGKAKQAARPNTTNLDNIIINHATLSYCLNVLAHMIHKGEDAYLPIFKRIKSELDKLEHDSELKDLAKTIVAQNALNTRFNNQTFH